jgi:Probable lipoprotein LpqN
VTLGQSVSAAGVVALALVLAGCGSKPPDYQSIWSTSATATTTVPTTSQTLVPLARYLEGAGVQGQPVAPSALTDLTVTLPRPAGWEKYSNANFSPQTEMIARNDTYPTAMLMVFRLQGGFDAQEAVRHATADAMLSPGFTKLNESFTDFDGFPSAMIEGSYDGANDRRLHSYNRVVIPVTPAPEFQRYLVQLTVTSLADRAVADADDIQGIIDGFTITVK